jgi:hypothetical protein
MCGGRVGVGVPQREQHQAQRRRQGEAQNQQPFAATATRPRPTLPLASAAVDALRVCSCVSVHGLPLHLFCMHAGKERGWSGAQNSNNNIH